MVQSMNTKVDLISNATYFVGLSSNGKIMIGDKAFEYYDDRNPNNYVQIPWDQVDLVIAAVYFNKWIPRFLIRTKHNGQFRFSARNNKKVLRAVREYVLADHIVRSLTFFQVLRRGIKSIFIKNKK